MHNGLRTGIITSGLVLDMSRLLKQGILCDLAIYVHQIGYAEDRVTYPNHMADCGSSDSSSQERVIRAHRALVAVRCPSLLESARPDSERHNFAVIDVEGDLEVFGSFVHFLYTGLFTDVEVESANRHSTGMSELRCKATNDSRLITELVRINARFPVDGLERILWQSEKQQTLSKETLHGQTLPKLVDALSTLLYSCSMDDALCDITLRVPLHHPGDPLATEKTEYERRPAHQFVLAARSTCFPRPFLFFLHGRELKVGGTIEASTFERCSTSRLAAKPCTS